MTTTGQERAADGTFGPSLPPPPPIAPAPVAQPAAEDKPEKFSRKAPMVPVRNVTGTAATVAAAAVTSAGAVAGSGWVLTGLAGIAGTVGAVAAAKPEQTKRTTRRTVTVTRKVGSAGVASTKRASAGAVRRSTGAAKRSGGAAKRAVSPSARRAAATKRGPVGGQMSKREARLAAKAPATKVKAARALETKERRRQAKANTAKAIADRVAPKPKLRAVPSAGRSSTRSGVAGGTAGKRGTGGRGTASSGPRAGRLLGGSTRKGGGSAGGRKIGSIAGRKGSGSSTRKGSVAGGRRSGATGTTKHGDGGRTSSPRGYAGKPLGSSTYGGGKPTLVARGRARFADRIREQVGIAGPKHKGILAHHRQLEEEKERKKAHQEERRIASRAYRVRSLFALTPDAKKRARDDYAAVLSRIDDTYKLGARLVSPLDLTDDNNPLIAQPTTGGNTMPKFNPSKFSIAEYVNDQATKIRSHPHDEAMDAVYFADMLPEDFRAVHNWLAAMASRVNAGPFEKTVKDDIYGVADASQKLLGLGEDIPKRIRRAHAEDIDRHENPRQGEKQWNTQ
ncbi:MAG: hypothetical protein ACRDS9_07805 [Pseudonocardiaceae bacterium]